MSVTAILFTVLTATAAVLLILRGFDPHPERLEPDYDENGLELPLRQFHRPGRLTRKDVLPLLLITLLYAVLAFWGLGDRTGITSWHTFAEAGDAVVLRPETPADVTAIRWYGGGNVGSYLVEWSADGETWQDADTWDQNYVAVLGWHETRPEEPLRGLREVRVTSLKRGLCLGEVALEGAEGLLPLTGGAELTDEQALVPDAANWRNSSYFDEIYHVRTAWEHMTDRKPYEITHPPLGKLIIALGIRLFGLVPFGWRFSGTLFGVLMLPLLYCFLKKLTDDTRITACVTVVFALDFMHYVQTRIATIDTYSVIFTILMYYFFYLYYTLPTDTPLRKTLPTLGLSGLFFALGVAAKWTCAFAGAGLAVLWCVRQGTVLREQKILGRPEPWRNCFWPTVGWSCVFFLLLPVIAYLLVYIPYARAENVRLFSADYPKLILENIRYMYSYHSRLEATHPYQSTWWQWIFDLRPILYYLSYSGDGLSRVSFGACGNPLFWWTGLGAVVCMFVQTLRGDRISLLILAGYLSTLLPWVGVERCAFIYHYFPCTVFLALALAKMLKGKLRAGARHRRTAPLLAAGCAVLFAVFYPALSGIEYTGAYGHALLRWFAGSWPF